MELRGAFADSRQTRLGFRKAQEKTMLHSIQFRRPARFTASLLALLLFALSLTVVAQNPPLSPSDTVREFYKAMREKRFKDAFALSIYKPAIEGLKPQEFDDLKPDFDAMAAAIPEKVEINGEQISGDVATVFAKVPSGDDAAAEPVPVTLMKIDGQWIIGDKENQDIVRKAGNRFFFNARIDTHHNEVKTMLQRISVAELVYSQQHNGVFGDIPTVIASGLLPKDLEGTESTGYRFHVTLGKDAKSYSVGAEPAEYGRTGRLSFFMDQSGIRSGDVAGKPLPTPPRIP
jgi:hypothetical protein